MRNRSANCLALGTIVCLFAMRAVAAAPNGELHVLFIGNSFTYYHELPKMIAELAKAGGQRPLRFQQETPGGYTLERHWDNQKTLKTLRSRNWDYVVLQDQSQMPLQRRDAMFEYGKKFDSEIKKHGGKTILYQTWALQSKAEQQKAISNAYEELSKDLKAQLAPVGNAWQTALSLDKKPVLHDKDQKHPSATGTYLAACVFYATIYGKSPEGLPGRMGGLSDKEARPLQAIAWKTVQAANN